jgi:hypothetical protein
MFLFQFRELIIKLLVPRIENEYLEAQRRGADDKICEGKAAREKHGDRDLKAVVSFFFLLWQPVISR